MWDVHLNIHISHYIHTYFICIYTLTHHIYIRIICAYLYMLCMHTHMHSTYAYINACKYTFVYICIYKFILFLVMSAAQIIYVCVKLSGQSSKLHVLWRWTGYTGHICPLLAAFCCSLISLHSWFPHPGPQQTPCWAVVGVRNKILSSACISFSMLSK